MPNKIIDGITMPMTDSEVSALLSEEASMLPLLVRMERDTLLSKSDIYALSDRITDEWRTYRQELRDLPSQSGFPTTVTWPTKP
jgi:hypothetical protein